MSWEDRSWNRGDSGGGERTFSSNPLSWSPTIGRLSGIRIDVHILFIIFIAIELLRAAADGDFWWGLRYMLILFGIVLLHEFGHCFGARYVGGAATHILMWPLGGLAHVQPPHRPGAMFFTAFAGPLVNLIICALTAAILILVTGTIQAVPWNPYHATIPLSVAHQYARFEVLSWLYQIFLVSYILFIFNALLPVYPLDGGQMFQAIAWTRMGYRRSMLLATTVGMVGAVVLGCYGLFSQSFLLIGIAVFGYVTCMQQRQFALSLSEFDIGEEDWSAAAAPRSGGLRQRLRSGAWARRQKKIAEEETLVDQILDKVHREGIGNLTRKERRILAQATQRQRERERAAGRIDRL